MVTSRARRSGLIQESQADHVATTVSRPANGTEPAHRSGAPLPDPLRRGMEVRFGHDFSGVRVHTDNAAGRSARAMGAAAYTLGENIVFGAGRFALSTVEGTRLLVHELTHVVQQATSGRRVQCKPDPAAGPFAVGKLRAPILAVFANFDHAKAELKPEHTPLLRSLAELYFTIGAAAPGAVLVLTGHTDLTGGEQVNVDLARSRAAAVAVAMNRAGVSPVAIRVESAGESEPVVGTPDQEPRNRRVEARIEQIPSSFGLPPKFDPVDPRRQVLPPPRPPIFPPGPWPRSGIGPSPSPSASPPVPGPSVPRPDEESAPRPGNVGDVAKAALKAVLADRAIMKQFDDAKAQLERDFDKLTPGEKALTISVSASIAAGAVAGIASDPEARRTVLDALDGQDLPVPGVTWLKFHIKTKDAGGGITIDVYKFIGK
ncbi:DUF4157 domain-containing protein [Nocardia sp. XZ_19_231]|uniref:eCIS core domain-containing protein n=1 Tax=Nocardia sp. XZ_19_231 TaxID=2769252 RepID=UPI00188EA961|nr:DUF4157 domain-containing protein [Nocardia sp. XZ_19_231]